MTTTPTPDPDAALVERVTNAVHYIRFKAQRDGTYAYTSEEVARAAIAEMREADRWVPCSERMPEDGQEVFVMRRGLCNYMRFFRSRHGRPDRFELGGTYWWMRYDGDDEVTHWRPPPPPPATDATTTSKDKP